MQYQQKHYTPDEITKINKTKYGSSNTDPYGMKLVNEDIPVECKHLRIDIDLNEDFKTFQEIDLERNKQFQLTETDSFGIDIRMELPEFHYVPSIENFDFLPGDDILFGFERKKKMEEVENETEENDLENYNEVGVEEQMKDIENALNDKSTKNTNIEFLIPKLK